MAVTSVSRLRIGICAGINVSEGCNATAQRNTKRKMPERLHREKKNGSTIVCMEGAEQIRHRNVILQFLAPGIDQKGAMQNLETFFVHRCFPAHSPEENGLLLSEGG